METDKLIQLVDSYLELTEAGSGNVVLCVNKGRMDELPETVNGVPVKMAVGGQKGGIYTVEEYERLKSLYADEREQQKGAQEKESKAESRGTQVKSLSPVPTLTPVTHPEADRQTTAPVAPITPLPDAPTKTDTPAKTASSSIPKEEKKNANNYAK